MERDRLTLGAAVETWQELHLGNRRERYRSEAVRALRHAFVKAWDRPADALDRAAVVRTFDAIAKAGHGAIAARTAVMGARALRGARSAARSQQSVCNPAGFRPAGKPRAGAVDLEVAAVWHAAKTMPGASGRTVRPLILTGARRSEVAGMLWSELDADLDAWTVGRDRMKAGAAHVVPCRRNLRTLLAEIDVAMGWCCRASGRGDHGAAGRKAKRRSIRRLASRAGDCTMFGGRSRPACSVSACASK